MRLENYLETRMEARKSTQLQARREARKSTQLQAGAEPLAQLKPPVLVPP